jgi:hypothetical protein
MKSKSETSNTVRQFVAMIKTQYDKNVKCIKSDNGPEFSMKDFYAKKGMIHQVSCVECPEQNGRVERKHQHILSVARSIMHQSNIPKVFWTYAIAHAA